MKTRKNKRRTTNSRKKMTNTSKNKRRTTNTRKKMTNTRRKHQISKKPTRKHRIKRGGLFEKTKARIAYKLAPQSNYATEAVNVASRKILDDYSNEMAEKYKGDITTTCDVNTKQCKCSSNNSHINQLIKAIKVSCDNNECDECNKFKEKIEAFKKIPYEEWKTYPAQRISYLPPIKSKFVSYYNGSRSYKQQYQTSVDEYIMSHKDQCVKDTIERIKEIIPGISNLNSTAIKPVADAILQIYPSADKNNRNVYNPITIYKPSVHNFYTVDDFNCVLNRRYPETIPDCNKIMQILTVLNKNNKNSSSGPNTTQFILYLDNGDWNIYLVPRDDYIKDVLDSMPSDGLSDESIVDTNEDETDEPEAIETVTSEKIQDPVVASEDRGDEDGGDEDEIDYTY